MSDEREVAERVIRLRRRNEAKFWERFEALGYTLWEQRVVYQSRRTGRRFIGEHRSEFLRGGGEA